MHIETTTARLMLTERCAIIRTTRYYRDQPGMPSHEFQCKHTATVIVGGVPMCRKHAGAALLEWALGN